LAAIDFVFIKSNVGKLSAPLRQSTGRLQHQPDSFAVGWGGAGGQRVCAQIMLNQKAR
jgi:hypothetical protein